jgi:hypothetical protein
MRLRDKFMFMPVDGCSELVNNASELGETDAGLVRLAGGDVMRGWRTFLFAAAIVCSPPAIASTELHLGAGGPGGLFREATVTGLGVGAGALQSPPVFQAGPWADDGTPADDGAYAVAAASLENRTFVAPDDASSDRSGWMLLLIAFMGLTAVFTGKRPRARGLIVV